MPPIPTIANPKKAAHPAYKFTVDYPSGWFDSTDGAKVTAGGLLDADTLRAAGVKPTDTLTNVNVADKSNYPGLTVYRLANFTDTADAVAQRMIAFSQTSTVTKASSIRSWCIDGTPARGFGLASTTAFQESWFAVHAGALYYAFFIGKTDGTQATQNALESTFSSILVTWKWS